MPRDDRVPFLFPRTVLPANLKVGEELSLDIARTTSMEGVGIRCCVTRIITPEEGTEEKEEENKEEEEEEQEEDAEAEEEDDDDVEQEEHDDDGTEQDDDDDDAEQDGDIDQDGNENEAHFSTLVGRSVDVDSDGNEDEHGAERFGTLEEPSLDTAASQDAVEGGGGVKRSLHDAFNQDDDAESTSVPAQQRIRLDVDSTE